MAGRALVYGLALAGEATARALVARGWEVVVADDRPAPDAAERAAALGADLHVAPDAAALERLVAGVDLVVPSPGVPEHHRALRGDAAPRACRCAREIDLAYEWEQARPGGPRPMVAVTGHRRQDHHHAAGHGHGGGRRAGGRWRPATPRCPW